MADEQTNRDSLLWQADFSRRGGSPVVARLCEGLHAVLDHGSATGRRFLCWPGEPRADALPLRLQGPFHWLVRAGKAPELAPVYAGATIDAATIQAELRHTITAHDAVIAGWLDGPPQTNEPGRSAVLMAGLTVLAARFGLPVDLMEIGSSAGLNLLIDRYRFDLGGVRQGPDGSPLTIRPEWRGRPPPPAAVSIARVRGVDIAPIDIADPAAAERLLAYVWIDQPGRMARMEQAVALARIHPPALARGDAADWVEARLAEPQPDGIARVLMHSVVWQYLPPEGQQRIEQAMATAGARATEDRPLAWLAYEADRTLNVHSLILRCWPGDGTPQRLATAHPHGSWVEWEDDACPAP